MSNKTLKLLLFLLLYSLSNSIAQTDLKSERSAIEISDIQLLLGDWKGTLTYIDYSSNNPYTMPCEVVIKAKKKNRKLYLYYTYPDEPKANSKGKLKISKDQFKLNGQPIIARSTLSDGTIQIITSFSNKDGNDRQKAMIRNIYIIGAEELIMRKEVQFEGTEKWLKRNEFNFKRG